VLIAGDFKQVELRAMAYITADPTMTGVYAAGGDLHVETALAMVGKTREEVSTEELKFLRNRAKAVNFSIIYGAGGKGLAETAWKNYGIQMTEAEGAVAIGRFFEKYPFVKQWKKKSFVESTRLGLVRIGCGRVVEARWEKAPKLSPQQCANLPIQGVCADLMLIAIRLTYEQLRAAKVAGGIVASIHDELLLEVAAADAERTQQILAATMTEAFELIFPGAPTTGGVVELKTGASWGELHAITTDLGRTDLAPSC
jgi:DNA polymerase-1